MGWNLPLGSDVQPMGGAPAIVASTIVATSLVASGNVSAARFRAGDGTLALPAYSYTADDDLGEYRTGAGSLARVHASAFMETIATGGHTLGAAVTVAVGLSMGAATTLKLDPGTVALPGLTFAGDTDTGFYRVGANQAAATGGGAQSVYFPAAGLGVNGYVSMTGPLLFNEQGAAPAGIADYGQLFAIDTGGGKTSVRIRCGAAGTQFVLGTEV